MIPIASICAQTCAFVMAFATRRVWSKWRR
jgi:hypothetical protein